jgi:hypothetical protein
MSDVNNTLRHSALMMKITGWGLIVGSVGAFIYPAGFLWGRLVIALVDAGLDTCFANPDTSEMQLASSPAGRKP